MYVCRSRLPLLGKARECCFGLVGAFALNPRRIEAIWGPRREHRDRSVARNRRFGAVALLELDRWDVAERRVQPAVVEPGDPFDDRELELAAGAPDAVGDQLVLEAVDEGLGHRVAGCALGGGHVRAGHRGFDEPARRRPPRGPTTPPP